jgi:NAD-dependent SIR2 family protein deacetylase
MLATAKKHISKLVDMISSVPAQSIIIMQGAGISVNAGIPDFRTPWTGFYSRVQALGLSQPEEIFNIRLFKRDPRPFYAVAHELLPGRFRPTPTHYFSNVLASKNKLLRTYTQNIDGLEKLAGLDESFLVEAHGHFRSAHCSSCGFETPIEYVIAAAQRGMPVKCPCGGWVKPDIVFFGENLPPKYFELSDDDFPKCKLLVVLGTSLQVNPFAAMVGWVGPEVPRFLVNREKAGGFRDEGDQANDFFIEGDCDEAVTHIIDGLGWTADLKKLLQK